VTLWKGFGPFFMTGVAVFDGLGLVAQLVGFDAGTHFQSALQNGFAVVAILVEFFQQTP